MPPVPNIRNVLSDFLVACTRRDLFLKAELRSDEDTHLVRLRWNRVNDPLPVRDYIVVRIQCATDEIDIQEVGRRGFRGVVDPILQALAECYADPNHLD